MSASADQRGGDLLTRPLTFTGRELVVNYRAPPGGSARIERQEAGGQAYPGLSLKDCTPLCGDSTEAVVAWKEGSDASSLSPLPVRLRLRIKGGDVYSFRFR